MKRSLCILVFALVAITNLLAQVIETPVSYAYLPGRESTLKYKFSYEDETFYTNLRFIKGSQNVFKAGDQIVMTPEEGNPTTFVVTGEKLKNSTSDYLPFETSAEGVDIIMRGIQTISLVRNGQTYWLEQNKYFNTRTMRDARKLAHNAYKLDIKKKSISLKAEAKRQIIEQKRLACGDVYPTWRVGLKNEKEQTNKSNYKSWRKNSNASEEGQTGESSYKNWRD